ncbi:MAG: hypothetical protein ABFD54_12120, partial [Armatimonadota bacterium]
VALSWKPRFGVSVDDEPSYAVPIIIKHVRGPLYNLLYSDNPPRQSGMHKNRYSVILGIIYTTS